MRNYTKQAIVLGKIKTEGKNNFKMKEKRDDEGKCFLLGTFFAFIRVFSSVIYCYGCRVFIWSPGSFEPGKGGTF
ncbi:predicted protein [Methanosarcina acetivorans C2A]|uniref:Uncharacterized protein n=1 Tax=Methanosarcina acetivorans (strain ATCC 35395 / DSM 2834 / JCM 12185 / C2A) TaxID=188937 RepID=Q8TTG7_METAC|nr:predicted protein [Methanosarcina acetivorans C2A]